LLPDGKTACGVSLTASNFPGAYGNGSTEPMYAKYIYPPEGQSGTMTLNGLPTGTCSVYAYSFDGNFTLTVGGVNEGAQTTTYNYPTINPPPWIEGLHYALWSDVPVTAGESMVLTVLPGHDGYAVISGLQITCSGSWPTLPSITVPPQSQAVCVGGRVTFSVAATGAAPWSYQWTFNGTNIAGATNSIYTINNAQTSAAGTYAVVVTDSSGSTTSSGATLSVGSFAVWVSEPMGICNIP